MNSKPEGEKTLSANHPRAQESEWYDHHYRTLDTAAGSPQRSEWELVRHLGSWYAFSLPILRRLLKPTSRLLELGCGSGRMPCQLVREGLVPAENIHGLDQSQVAVERASAALPGAHFQPGDIYNLHLPKEYFHVATLMEVIEHLEEPNHALKQISDVLVPGGHLIISFPNFVHLPWLVVRILAEKLNKPNWVVLQPVDKIYTIWKVRALAEAAGFTFVEGVGSNFGPPLLDRLERPWMTRALNKLGIWWVSFHPIMVFRKTA